MSISKELYMGFKNWLNEEDENKSNLCYYYSQYNGTKLRYIRNAEYHRELSTLFHAEGLDDTYPFNESAEEFSLEEADDTFYNNQRRMNFVLKHVDEYEKEHGHD